MNAARTFFRVYLIVYYVLLLGAGLTLWRSGLLARFPTVWVVAVGISAMSLGLLLAAVSRQGKREGRSAADGSTRGDESN